LKESMGLGEDPEDASWLSITAMNKETGKVEKRVRLPLWALLSCPVLFSCPLLPSPVLSQPVLSQPVLSQPVLSLSISLSLLLLCSPVLSCTARCHRMCCSVVCCSVMLSRVLTPLCDAVQGDVLISIEILPKEVADATPAGLGRSEPNANPYLPPPVGRMKLVRPHAMLL
jgi:hypothetical protein